jgi:hypothetical protein
VGRRERGTGDVRPTDPGNRVSTLHG